VATFFKPRLPDAKAAAVAPKDQAGEAAAAVAAAPKQQAGDEVAEQHASYWPSSEPTVLILAVASSKPSVQARVLANIRAVGSRPGVGFGVILYEGQAADWTGVRTTAKELGVDFHIMKGEHPKGKKDADFVPKFYFQAQARAWIGHYDWVWLVDDDMSFSTFDYAEFWRRHQHGFKRGPPRVSQPPLVDVGKRDSGDRAAYLKEQYVANRTTNTFVVDMVEQGCPLIRVDFWMWFTNALDADVGDNFAVQQASHGSDWGLDCLWCQYAQLYLANTTACGVIPVSLLHENGQSIGSIMDHRSASTNGMAFFAYLLAHNLRGKSECKHNLCGSIYGPK
jgi:hypothetical protein